MKARSFSLAGAVTLIVACFCALPAVRAQQKGGAAFPPLEDWKKAVISGDPVSVKMLYSSSPAARIQTPNGEVGPDSDATFWSALKVKAMKIDVQQITSPQPGAEQVVFQAEVHTAMAARPVYVSAAQLWAQQQGVWKVVAAQRSDTARLQQPLSTKKEIYEENADAHLQIRHALAQASAGRKRVLVVFGANWCYDCHVLDLAFHRPDLTPLLDRGFVVVHIDVGRGDKNQDLMTQYQVPMKRGIPGVAVLDSNGKLLYSQQNGEFEKARSLAPDDLLAFLNKWKPQAQ